MSTPDDVFRLFGAAFLGTSLAWLLPVTPALIESGSFPPFADGTLWVTRGVASAILIAGTGLAFIRDPGATRRFSGFDVVFAFGLTTAFAVIALVMSPSIPLATMLLIPLFWSGVRSETHVAALHSVYTTVAILAVVAGSLGAVFGTEYDTAAMSVRLHLFVIVSFLISLVVSTAVNEFIRINADLTTVAETARRRADARTRSAPSPRPSPTPSWRWISEVMPPPSTPADAGSSTPGAVEEGDVLTRLGVTSSPSSYRRPTTGV